MARAKKKYPDITKLTGLDWEKQKEEPYPPEVVADCDFCGTTIYEGQSYYLARHPDINKDPSGGEALFNACHSCSTKAGLEW